jgi:hypothetical protein
MPIITAIQQHPTANTTGGPIPLIINHLRGKSAEHLSSAAGRVMDRALVRIVGMWVLFFHYFLVEFRHLRSGM